MKESLRETRIHGNVQLCLMEFQEGGDRVNEGHNIERNYKK